MEIFPSVFTRVLVLVPPPMNPLEQRLKYKLNLDSLQCTRPVSSTGILGQLHSGKSLCLTFGDLTCIIRAALLLTGGDLRGFNQWNVQVVLNATNFRLHRQTKLSAASQQPSVILSTDATEHHINNWSSSVASSNM